MKEMEKDILKAERSEVDKLLEIKIINRENAVFKQTAGGLLTLHLEGEDKGQVNVIRTFPFTDADSFLSVRTADDKQRELGLIEKLSDLDEETVKIITHQLEMRYFMPQILRIYSVKEEYGHTYWHVLTDKGECRFTSPSGSAGAVMRKGNRAIICDCDRNRFEIKDVSKLTAKELKKLDLYL